MKTMINKIQFLANNSTGVPIYYSNAVDVGHSPGLSVTSIDNGNIALYDKDILFKVKKNPPTQTKNRVDIYMSLESACNLAGELARFTVNVQPVVWPLFRGDPNKNAGGRMKLPGIISSYSSRGVRVIARVSSGVSMQQENCYVNIDIEVPADGHIMMKGTELHIGVSLDPPKGAHDYKAGSLVVVPLHELQKGTGEQNPIQKVTGDFMLEFTPGVAAGLAVLLNQVCGCRAHS
ncbi:hypothetical protein [Dyella acidiphila]|uniref:PilZ domain-containing protein n=1 Tax=Dyella acidiphila TaxID=2775866 RepID=A0ABR9GFI8_9GAMM|nr:hypothetical protein [Dyella acidiphila]MBE1162785.1 hypothetical protein [Dyella acidiphila]